MARDDHDDLEPQHYAGAVAFGILGAFLFWLAMGPGLSPYIVWMPIAGALIVAMLCLPEPAAGRAQTVCAALGYPIVLAGISGVALMPGLIAYSFSKSVSENYPRWLQVVTLLLWFLVLAVTSLLLYSRAIRRRIRAWIDQEMPEGVRNSVPSETVTPWAAVLLYLNFVFIAAGCFASIAYLLNGMSSPGLFVPKTRPVEHGTLADFLLWQLLDAIPGLKVPETIKWKAPLGYERSLAGWVVLLFKVMVIIPVVSGLGHYLRDEDSANESESGAARRRGSVSPSQ